MSPPAGDDTRLSPRYYTQCPGCLTLFQLDQRHLDVAEGRVRCGLCGDVFDARQRLHRSLPRDLMVDPDVLRLLAERKAGHGASGDDDRAPDALAGGTAEQAAEKPVPARPAGAPSVSAPPDWRRTTALELEGAEAARSRRRWPWLVGCIVLTLALALQLLWFERNTLARDPAWRPAALRICRLLGCDLPLRRRPDLVAVTARSLRVDPDRPGALVFDATIVNRAPEAQPWPQLGLTLSTISGRTVGQRWFVAGEYLAQPARARRPMPAGEPAAVHLMFRDPGSGADNFELSFR